MNGYVFLSVQSKAFGSRQFSNQQAMNIKSFKITPNRATGGHLVNRCLWMQLSLCSLLVSISKTQMYLSDRKRLKNRNNVWTEEILFCLDILAQTKTPPLYIIPWIRHYTSGGLMNVICQDFQTELLFVFNRWVWTPSPLHYHHYYPTSFMSPLHCEST